MHAVGTTSWDHIGTILIPSWAFVCSCMVSWNPEWCMHGLWIWIHDYGLCIIDYGLCIVHGLWIAEHGYMHSIDGLWICIIEYGLWIMAIWIMDYGSIIQSIHQSITPPSQQSITLSFHHSIITSFHSSSIPWSIHLLDQISSMDYFWWIICICRHGFLPFDFVWLPQSVHSIVMWCSELQQSTANLDG